MPPTHGGGPLTSSGDSDHNNKDGSPNIIVFVFCCHGVEIKIPRTKVYALLLLDQWPPSTICEKTSIEVKNLARELMNVQDLSPNFYHRYYLLRQ